jgi:hypothetical protein
VFDRPIGLLIMAAMYEQQLDLFSSAGIQAECPLPQSMELRPAATALDDQAFVLRPGFETPG